MDAATITTLIGSLGFPIVMCGWFAFFCQKTIKEMQTAITNNTNAITELTKKLTKGSDKDEEN